VRSVVGAALSAGAGDSISAAKIGFATAVSANTLTAKMTLRFMICPPPGTLTARRHACTRMRQRAVDYSPLLQKGPETIGRVWCPKERSWAWPMRESWGCKSMLCHTAA
jgi:hypothetical protein